MIIIFIFIYIYTVIWFIFVLSVLNFGGDLISFL